ncbi:uroporphyrinogen-III synthase [biofilm metagenome]
MINALVGAHILVTRPAHQAENLCQLINHCGGRAVRFPTIDIVGVSPTINPAKFGLAATNALPQLSKYQWLIFTSANAVNFALAANGGKIDEFKATQIASIGQATARELEHSGLTVNLLPESGFDSEALLAMPQLQDVKGQDILIVRGQGGREELANTLMQRSANVDYWEVYQRVIPKIDKTAVTALIEQNVVDATIITSCEGLQNLSVMLGVDCINKLSPVPLVVISDRIRKLAAGLGFTRITVTENPSDTAILEAAIAIINGE